MGDFWPRNDSLNGSGLARIARHTRCIRAALTVQLYGELVMSLINLVVTLVVVGVILWLINTYIPMEGRIKSILNVVVIIVVILWLLSAFGIIGPIAGIHIGR